MERKDYNGYTNNETWVVALWIDNDQGSQEYWESVAAEIVSEDSPAYIADENQQKCTLAERLKQEHEDALPELNGFAADLLNAGFSEVDWYDIAENLISNAKENAA